MISVSQFRLTLAQRISRKWTALLLSTIRGDYEPWSFRIAPDRKSALENFEAFEAMERDWKTAVCLDPEIELAFRTVRWRGAGGGRQVPDRITFLTIESLFRFLSLGQFTESWERGARKIEEAARVLSSECAEVLARDAKFLDDPSEGALERLLGVVLFLREHPRADCFVRELPAEGVDSKWLEMNEGRVCRLLSVMLGEEISPETLYKRWGLKKPPFLVAVRHGQAFLPGLDPELPVALPLEALCTPPKALVILENLQTGLSIRSIPDDVPVVMGLGFGAARLAELDWISRVPVFYFGDLDRHGLRILADFRKFAPQAESVLMNLKTFEEHQAFAVKDPTWNNPETAPISLTDSESELYRRLQETLLRLEQERIPMRAVSEAFRKIFSASL